MMTMKTLEQYAGLYDDIALLEERIRRYREEAAGVVSDSVKDYRSGYPHIITITGLEIKVAEKLKQTREKLAERRARLEFLRDEVEIFLDAVDDGTVRRIIQYRYMGRRKMSWNQTAMKIWGFPCGDRARKRLKRFLQNV